MSALIDLTNKLFGRLTVIVRMDNDKQGRSRWLCKCDCGNEKIIRGSHLQSGSIKSCGCLKIEKTIERSTKHGHKTRKRVTVTYKSWQDMIQRCTNPNYHHYKDYGGRGITVCKRWSGENGFIHFLEDMGEAPRGFQIERIKNNLGYSKENCEWETPKQQARNKRNNIYITHNGRIQLLIEWSEETDIPYNILWNRIYKLKRTIEKALTTSVWRKRNGKKRNESKG